MILRVASRRISGWLARPQVILALLFVLFLLANAAAAYAHDISQADRATVQQIEGPAPFLFLYLGAKHMVTGIDHVLFLIGVVFFLYRLRDVVIYVTMFTIGHSLTLLGGVLLNTGANSYIVDAIIGFSVVYKAFENLGGFKKLGLAINTKLAVFVFGLFHGLGLATKVRDLGLSEDGLLINLISFNIGVEIGQVLVLAVVVTLLNLWRGTRSFAPSAFYANLALMTGGFVLMGYQLTGYFTS
ncbi:HupE/UreJ family protein [Croceibacterium sp. LX-88]|uniref:HupE/UreJ family protein n=1 Tax=Croceibacterium selenioxidans TaxID=2838833 RepID=A0ABS5W3U7_9SPHN|nr:HupE/UreJ family protein [Croceibacterium selenioxidans]